MADERSANAIDRKLGERVRARRLELSISQEQLADTLGVTFQQVQKYEKGVNRIAASRLFAISAALDMPVAEFFKSLSARRAAEPTQAVYLDAFATPEGAELIGLFAMIKSIKVRRRAVELIRALANGQDN